jgi:hypothetical protein
MWIHILIPIQAKDNQTLNDIIIALPLWLHDTDSKKCFKIYEKYDHGIINKLKHIISAEKMIVVHNATH